MRKEILFSEREHQFIVFKLGREEYVVPITCVQEIIMPQDATHIPKFPDWAEGVINLRGRIIPVIDGKKKFSIEKTNQDQINTRIIIFDIEHETIGLIVDKVEEVIHLKTEDIEPSPVDAENFTDFIWGVGKFQGRLLILINPHKLLPEAGVCDFNNTIAA